MSPLPQALYSNPPKAIPLWISSALVGCFLLNFSILLMEDEKLDKKTLASISGYYGPGSCLAWIVVLLTNVEFIVYAKILCRMWKREQLFKDEDILQFQIDPTIIGSLAYSVVATGHYYKISHQNPNSGDSDQPQRAVMRLAFFASVLAIVTYLPYGVLLPWHSATHIQGKQFSHKSFHGRYMLWIVTSIFVTCPGLCEKLSFLIQDFVVWTAPIECYGAPYVKRKELGTNRNPAITLSRYLLGVKAIAIVLGILSEPFSLKRAWIFAFPQSPASITDLDQAAALGVALFSVIAGVVTSKKTQQKDKSRSTRAQNMELPSYGFRGSQHNPADSGLHPVHFKT